MSTPPKTVVPDKHDREHDSVMTASSIIHGLWCASLTPIDPDGRVDHDRLANHCFDLLGGVVDGIVLFGTTGEGPSFSVRERMIGLEALMERGVPSSRIMPAISCTAFPDAIRLIEHALQSGCARCLAMPPCFWKGLSDDMVAAYYSKLIDDVGDSRLRLYLYHIPQLSGVAIKPAVAECLRRRYPEIIAGIKDSGGRFRETRMLLQQLPELAILVGHEPHIPRALAAGAAGTICGAANLLPRTVAGLFKPENRRLHQTRINGFLRLIEPFPFVPALKALMAAFRADETWNRVRPPLIPLTPAVSQALVAGFHQTKIGVPR